MQSPRGRTWRVGAKPCYRNLWSYLRALALHVYQHGRCICHSLEVWVMSWSSLAFAVRIACLLSRLMSPWGRMSARGPLMSVSDSCVEARNRYRMQGCAATRLSCPQLLLTTSLCIVDILKLGLLGYVGSKTAILLLVLCTREPDPARQAGRCK